MAMADDRLSELPESLIHEILSRLPMREVVATTLLSKRWKDLWTTAPYLRFHSESDGDDLRELRRFFSRVVALWNGEKILNLSIRFELRYSDESDVDSWLRFAIDKQVEELYLEAIDDPGHFPPSLYSCPSIRKLTLRFIDLYLDESLSWNQLKSLTIEGVEPLTETCTNVILKGAPLLEFLNLKIEEVMDNLKIESESLKVLKIDYFVIDPQFTNEAAVLRVVAPNLENLELSGLSHTRCLLKVPSLKNAVLGFDNRDNMLLEEHSLRKLAEEAFRLDFQSISHVENLTLNEWSFKLLVDQMENEFFVQFPNAKSLKLYAREAEGIPRALNMFPVLEMLAIEHREFAYYLVAPTTIFPDLSLLHLKTIEITWDVRDASMISVIKVLLQNAQVLEKLMIRFINHEADSRRFVSATKRVTKMRRSSPHATLIVTEELI